MQVNSDCFTGVPNEVKSEMSKCFEKRDLGRLEQVSTSWSDKKLINIMWKHLVDTQLPEIMQKNPNEMLKEKFKSYIEAQKQVVSYYQDAKKKGYSIHPNVDEVILSEAGLNAKASKIVEFLSKYPGSIYNLFYKDENVEAESTLESLLKMGLDPNFAHPQLGFEAGTFLHHAIDNKSLSMSQLLIKFGADIYLKGNNAHSPLERLYPELQLLVQKLGLMKLGRQDDKSQLSALLADIDSLIDTLFIRTHLSLS